MIIGKGAARSSRRNARDRPKTICRQTLRNEVPEAGKPALSCLPNRACKVTSLQRIFATSLDKQRSLSRCFDCEQRSPSVRLRVAFSRRVPCAHSRSALRRMLVALGDPLDRGGRRDWICERAFGRAHRGQPADRLLFLDDARDGRRHPRVSIDRFSAGTACDIAGLRTHAEIPAPACAIDFDPADSRTGQAPLICYAMDNHFFLRKPRSRDSDAIIASRLHPRNSDRSQRPRRRQCGMWRQGRA
jgi:hypothetical protein